MSKKNIRDLAKAAALAIKAKDRENAELAIAEGEQLYPNAKIPAGSGMVTWADMRLALEKAMAADETAETAPESAPEQEPELAEESADGDESAAEVAEESALAETEPEAAEESAEELPALVIRHTIDTGTMLLGAPGGAIGKQVSKVMGKNGQRWGFSFKLPIGAGWYVVKSRNGGADMVRILAAQKALEADGFTVTTDINTTDENGKVVAPNISAAELARRARERARMVDSLVWHMTCTEDGLPCSECQAPGLKSTAVARIIDTDRGVPAVVCLGCVGGAVMLPMPEEAAAPVLPVVEEPADDDDADDAPVAKPARVAKPKPVKAAPVVQSEQSALAGMTIETLVALVKLTGDADAAAEIVRRANMSAAPVAKAQPARKPSAAPVSAVPAVVVPDSGLITLTVELTDNAKVRATASDVRRNLYSHVTMSYRKNGVEITVFADRAERTLTVSMSIADADADVRTKIVNKAVKAAKATLGVLEVSAAAALV